MKEKIMRIAEFHCEDVQTVKDLLGAGKDNEAQDHSDEITETLLLVYLANTTATWHGCGGHVKAAHNRLNAEQYAERLRKLGYDVPPVDELLEFGLFNGVGSY